MIFQECLVAELWLRTNRQVILPSYISHSPRGFFENKQKTPRGIMILHHYNKIMIIRCLVAELLLKQVILSHFFINLSVYWYCFMPIRSKIVQNNYSKLTPSPLYIVTNLAILYNIFTKITHIITSVI